MKSLFIFILTASILIVSSRLYNVPHKRMHLRRYERAFPNGNCINNFCNQTEGYPTQHLQQIVTKDEKFASLFGKVISPYENFQIQARFNIEEKENLCASRAITMYPQKAKNIRNIWKTIVNIDGHLQGITFEVCIPNASCFQTNGLIAGYVTSCEQQYVVIRLVTLNASGQMSLEHFPIPSGCACVYSMKH